MSNEHIDKPDYVEELEDIRSRIYTLYEFEAQTPGALPAITKGLLGCIAENYHRWMYDNTVRISVEENGFLAYDVFCPTD